VSDKETEQKFSELLEVMAQLRSESGCPWDKEQTHISLKPCLLEETYELLDALDDGDPKKLKEELGDVLLQVIFHAQIAAEERRFAVKDVIALLTEKLIRRHPYVFAGEPLPERHRSRCLKQRLQIKASERKDGESKSALGNVPKAMPALARAQSITRRAAHLGFDWPDIEPVWGKVEEEMRELKNAAESGDKAAHRGGIGRSALVARQSRALFRRRSRRRLRSNDRPVHAPLSSYRNQTAKSRQEL
jgi:tetrapyrrole methylase family protein/MazG family protein